MNDIEQYQIWFNNAYCDYYNLYVSSPPSIPQVQEDYEEVDVEGRSDKLIINKGTYKRDNIKINFSLIDKSDYITSLDKALDYLLDYTDNFLKIDRMDRAYAVKKVIVGDITREYLSKGSFDVEFVVEPLATTSTITHYSYMSGYEVYNDGNYATDDLKIVLNTTVGSNITFTLNNTDTFTINNSPNKIMIDCNAMTCSDINKTTNYMNKMTGNFPTLKKGTNTITTSSNVDSFVLYYRKKYR